MSNAFTTLIPKIFADAMPSMRSAARAVRVCRTDFKPQVAAKGNVIDVPVPLASSTAAVAPGVTSASNTDQVPLTRQITLDQWRRSDKFTITAQEWATYDAMGFKASKFTEQLIAVIEEMNSVVLTGMKNSFYRRVGAAATAPYGSGVAANSTINVRKELQTMKAPMLDRHLMLDPTAEAAALGVAAISDASLRGNAEAKSAGVIGDVFGITHWGEQQIPTHTAGTAAGTLTHGTTIGAVGSGSLFLKASSTGTLKKGDLIGITTASVVYYYVVQADVAAVDTTAAGIEVTVLPKVQVTHVAADVWTLVATAVRNIGLQRGAYGLAIRPVDPGQCGVGTHINMADPETGLSILFSEIPEYMQTAYQVSALYGHAPLRHEWGVNLLG